MNAQHTPGPWLQTGSVVKTEDATVLAVCPAQIKKFDREAEAFGQARQCAEVSQANAKLISAAPDLTNALQMALATIERLTVRHGPFSSSDGTISVARAALTKAGISPLTPSPW